MTSLGPCGRARRADETSAALRFEIEHGRFRSAPSLPGERQLAGLLHVSRTTLRRALADLARQGLLVQQHGMGTFIARNQAGADPSGPAPPRAAEGSPAPAGASHSGELARGTDRPSPEEAMMLGLSPSSTVVRLSRLTLLDQGPACLDDAAIPFEFLPDLGFPDAALPDLLEARGIHPARTMQRLRTVRLEPSPAGHLGLEPNGLAVSIHTLFLLDDGRRCAFMHSLVRPDRLDLVYETRSFAHRPDRS